MTHNNQRKTISEELNSGERVVVSSLIQLDQPQIWRYTKALKHIKPTDKVLDVGCGCGYGTDILASESAHVTGIDDHTATIYHARQYFNKPNVTYLCKNLFDMKGKFNVVVALEILEHIKDAEKALQKLIDLSKSIVIITVPEIHSPLSQWHWKNYNEMEVRELFENNKMKVKRLMTVDFKCGKAIYCVAKKGR